jgi:hypothetical protein
VRRSEHDSKVPHSHKSSSRSKQRIHNFGQRLRRQYWFRARCSQIIHRQPRAFCPRRQFESSKSNWRASSSRDNFLIFSPTESQEALNLPRYGTPQSESALGREISHHLDCPLRHSSCLLLCPISRFQPVLCWLEYRKNHVPSNLRTSWVQEPVSDTKRGNCETASGCKSIAPSGASLTGWRIGINQGLVGGGANTKKESSVETLPKTTFSRAAVNLEDSSRCME